MINRLETSLLQAGKILDSIKIDYALLGGLAANLYRRDTRATQDVDLAVRASPGDVTRIANAFEQAGWTTQLRTSKAETLRLSHDDLARVDLLVAGTEFEEAAIDRAVKLTIDGNELAIVTPEDLIVYKLIAGRGHDYEAVAAIIDAGHEVDVSHVTGWLEQFGMAERWPRALEEARRLAEAG